jgi:hypothetical protein
VSPRVCHTHSIDVTIDGVGIGVDDPHALFALLLEVGCGGSVSTDSTNWKAFVGFVEFGSLRKCLSSGQRPGCD